MFIDVCFSDDAAYLGLVAMPWFKNKPADFFLSRQKDDIKGERSILWQEYVLFFTKNKLFFYRPIASITELNAAATNLLIILAV